MEKLGWGSKVFRFMYKQIFLRFSGQIRDPYLIRIDNILPDPKTNELTVSFHIANKRISQEMTVAEFVKTDMIYLIDPRIAFYMGQQFGAHSEKLAIIPKTQPTLKSKCVAGLKRVFIDE